jgi:hypothetical protein
MESRDGLHTTLLEHAQRRDPVKMGANFWVSLRSSISYQLRSYDLRRSVAVSSAGLHLVARGPCPYWVSNPDSPARSWLLYRANINNNNSNNKNNNRIIATGVLGF